MEATTNSSNNQIENSYEYGHFTFLVAKDRVVRQFGVQVRDWPDQTFYTLVSTYRDQIKVDHITDLMRKYGVQQLVNIPQELADLIQE